jgi:hypothetical protein
MIKLIEAIEGLRTLRDSAYIPEVQEGLMEGEEDWDLDRHPFEFLEDTIDILEDTMGTLLQLYNAVQLQEIRNTAKPKPKGKVGRPPKKELHKSEAQRVAELREAQRKAAKTEVREEVTDRLGQETEDDIFKQAEELFGA